MFKNCVFKVSVDTKKWLKAAAVVAGVVSVLTSVAGIPEVKEE